MEYAAASTPLAPPNCLRSMLPKLEIRLVDPDGVHELLDVVIHWGPPGGKSAEIPKSMDA
jgi:hypothetical protein